MITHYHYQYQDKTSAQFCFKVMVNGQIFNCSFSESGTDRHTARQPKTDQTGTVSGDMIQVAAAENFWGSIAAQLGGTHVNVISIVTDLNADPHEFETNTADALDFAHANYVILNGAGYDTWGQKLLAANPSNGCKVLYVADLLGKTEGDNPHFWYDPDYVQQVINQITGDYQSLDPADAAYSAPNKRHWKMRLRLTGN